MATDAEHKLQKMLALQTQGAVCPLSSIPLRYRGKADGRELVHHPTNSLSQSDRGSPIRALLLWVEFCRFCLKMVGERGRRRSTLVVRTPIFAGF